MQKRTLHRLLVNDVASALAEQRGLPATLVMVSSGSVTDPFIHSAVTAPIARQPFARAFKHPHLVPCS